MKRLITILLLFISAASIGQVLNASQPYRKVSTTVTPTYLLDAYPGAVAAYSLRKLKTGSTYAIQIRRLSDGAQSTIGFTATGDLDTSAIITFCGSGSCGVLNWYNQVDNLVSLMGASVSVMPLIDSSGVILRQNGKPCVSFHSASSQYFGAGNIMNGTTSRSVFTVQKAYTENAGAGGNLVYDLTSNTIVVGSYFGVSLEQSALFIRVNGYGSWSYPAGLSSTSYSLLSSFYTSGGDVTTVSNYMNNNSMSFLGFGGTMAPLNTHNANSTFGWSTNNGLYYNGSMQEFIFYNSNQISNISGIQSNINSYYSIY